MDRIWNENYQRQIITSSCHNYSLPSVTQKSCGSRAVNFITEDSLNKMNHEFHHLTPSEHIVLSQQVMMQFDLLQHRFAIASNLWFSAMFSSVSFSISMNRINYKRSQHNNTHM